MTPDTYDIMFIGHMVTEDEIIREGDCYAPHHPGGAVYLGSIAVANLGFRTAAVVKLARGDEYLVAPIAEAGIEIFAVPSPDTTTLQVIYEKRDMRERQVLVKKMAGRFTIDEIPPLKTGIVHIAGVSDQEVDVGILRGLKERGHRIACDVQTFTRWARGDCIEFRTWNELEEALPYIDILKCDNIEAPALAGVDDPLEAAGKIAEMGARELVMSSDTEIVVLEGGRLHREPLTNRSLDGRTGRGDTCIASYACARLEKDPAEALKFSAAVTSLKIERPGPFAGTLGDVAAKIEADYS